MARITQHFHYSRSIYELDVEQLLSLRKKNRENKLIFFMNSIILASTGGYLFYEGLQHLAIILYLLVNIMMMALFFLNQEINQINYAIYIKEHLE
jgi:hypothetical protein